MPEINEEFNLNILQENGESNQNVKFWITGHSMGGALAELFTLDLVESGVEPERIITYGFATPLVGNRRLQEHAQLIGASDRIFKIVHRQDMVAYIGYGLLWGRSLAADSNIIEFGSRGIFDRSHHSLPRIYLPFIISQNDYPLRQQLEASLVVA
ncbi:MAG: lipase family protein, partial [Oscillospiraceae bacterium]|nr:lipase family protein [Oscillospiraceae bacterium]